MNILGCLDRPTGGQYTLAGTPVAELDDDGLDNGPWSIRQQLVREVEVAPSESSIWRILVRRGLIVPQPKKRPKVSLRRFVYPRPNDCWQIDATHWHLADGTIVWIIDIIDDHSRVCPAAVAAGVCTKLWPLPS